MYGQELQVVYEIQSDRMREAQVNRLVREALSVSQKQSTFRVDTLTYLAHRLTNWAEPAGRRLVEWTRRGVPLRLRKEIESR